MVQEGELRQDRHQNGLVCYEFRSGEVLGLEEELVQAGKRVRGSEVGFKTVTLSGISFLIQAG